MSGDNEARWRRKKKEKVEQEEKDGGMERRALWLFPDVGTQ